MAEYEELRLTVTLIDNASQGLVTLRQNLRALGSGESVENITKLQQQVEGLSERMTKARGQFERTANAANFLGRTIAGAVSTFATAFISQFALESLKKFTDEMVRLDGTAKQFGVGGATIKSIVDQMKIMGVDASAAQQAVTGFATSLAELSRQGSQIRTELLKGARSDPAAMQAFLSRITGFASKGDMVSALNETISAADNIFRAEMERTRQETGQANELMAAELRNRFLNTLQLDPATMALVKGRLRAVSDLEKEEYERRRQVALAFNREWNEMDKKREDFVRGLQTGLLEPMREVNRLIGEMGDKWGEAIGKMLGGGFQTFLRDLDSVIRTFQLISEGRYAEALKEAFGANAWRGGQQRVGPEGLQKLTLEGVQEAIKKSPSLPQALPTPSPTPPLLSIPQDPNKALPPGVGDPRMSPLLQRMSYTPGQPIIVPGGAGGGDYTRSSGGAVSEFTRAIRTGVFEGMVDFKNYLGGGGAGGGGAAGAAVVKASLTTGSYSGTAAGTGFGGDGGSPGGGAAGPSGSSVGPGTGSGAGDTPAGQDGSGGAGSGGRGGGGRLPEAIPGEKGLAQRIGVAKAAFKDQLRKEGVPEANLEEAANVLAGQALSESGLNPKTVHDAGTGYGIYGARNDRRARMLKWMEQQGYSKDSLEGQARYMAREAMTDPEYKKSRDALMGATPENRRQTTDILTRNFERPANMRQNRTGEVGRAAGVAAADMPAATARDTTNSPNTGGGDQPVPSEILDRARAVAQLGPRELSEWMRKQGYPKHDQWCGDFAASVVKSAGGTPPKNWQLASNWRNSGQEVSAEEARPGDIAVARPGWSRRGSGRTGEVGSHVTILHSQPGKTFEGLGGNQSRRISQYNTRQFQFYRPNVGDSDTMTAGRRQMDRSSEIKATGKLKVDVRAPPGTNVEASGTGPFKTVEQERSTQMQPASNGPSADSPTWI